MFFERIEIHHFRGIESLTIDNIKQVNVLTGRNNCGKTSVLEAIFLLVGMSNPHLALNVHGFRGLTLTDDKDFSYLFNGFDFSKDLSITGRWESQERTLEIKPIYPTSTGIQEHLSKSGEASEETFLSSSTSTMMEEALEGLAFDFSMDKNGPFHAEIKLKQGNLNIPGIKLEQANVQFSPHYREKLSASFINPRTIMNSLHQRLEAILVRKDSEGIISALKEIEPNLNDIRLGAGGTIYADVIGIDKLVPIHLMGDGIIKIIAILAAISEGKNGILFIDEIENGLHYSSLMPLWKAILKMALESHVQLFIATHSDECIHAMVRTYQTYHESGIGEDFVSLFRIDRNRDGQHRAIQYDSDILLAGLGEDFEVR